jgi:predicted AlkP superfamily pyrophosphatase or phosphodiesterase
MKKKTFTFTVLAIIIVIAWSFPSRPLANPSFPNRPKLVVVLVIDQFRYDYLMRFRPYFVKAGFNLFLDGAVATDCRYDYASTITGPGHASLLTGAYSNLHGIVENEWYDRDQHRQVYCVEDRTTHIVDNRQNASTTPGFSPRNLIGSTLGDELRFATDFRSKVITISLKDRAAVLMGGHAPNAAYWYNEVKGGFVTSTYYATALPAWVDDFNQQSPARQFCGKKWQALPETPGSSGKVFSEFKTAPEDGCPSPKFLRWLNDTPFMNHIELDFATQAVHAEHLGQGTETDLLAVSLSVNDYIGHQFGPYSPQVADATLRTDRELAAFFANLDRVVGLQNVWITLSADHGVAPDPAFIQLHNLGPGIAPETKIIRDAAEKALDDSFGSGPWIENADKLYLYLNRDAMKKQNVMAAKAEEIAAQAVASLPDVAAAFTRTQFLTGSLPNSALARKAANSFNPKRSGDIFMILMPYEVQVSGLTGSSHGFPWSYDAQVPLIFWGSAFKPGFYATACQPIDLAATLAAVLGLTQPSGAEGRPLTWALK